uniref:Uncharacterized protein n=1 Tax=Anguilla anguilla TaxID=7936 RepID=A0A0E9VXF1_ANGAN
MQEISFRRSVQEISSEQCLILIEPYLPF